MVQTKYFCDICGKELNENEVHGINICVLHYNWGDSNYDIDNLDVCEKCRDLCTPVITYKDGFYKLRDYYKNGYADNR